MELPFNPQPKKTKFIRIKPKVKVRNEFSQSVRKQIKVRDNGCCRECGDPQAREIHHVKTKGSGGRGIFTNGLLVCHSCHRKLHHDPMLMQRWQLRFEQMYGPRFWEDEWD
jgi:5-methylcytosine-specific restriction endonuclease McrA